MEGEVVVVVGGVVVRGPVLMALAVVGWMVGSGCVSVIIHDLIEV